MFNEDVRVNTSNIQIQLLTLSVNQTPPQAPKEILPSSNRINPTPTTQEEQEKRRRLPTYTLLFNPVIVILTVLVVNYYARLISEFLVYYVASELLLPNIELIVEIEDTSNKDIRIKLEEPIPFKGEDSSAKVEIVVLDLVVPKTIEEAINRPNQDKQDKAINKEIDSLKENDTQDIVNRHNITSLILTRRQVFTIKRGA